MSKKSCGNCKYGDVESFNEPCIDCYMTSNFEPFIVEPRFIGFDKEITKSITNNEHKPDPIFDRQEFWFGGSGNRS